MQTNGINQYLDGGNNLSFERNNPFSISIWLKPTTLGIAGFISKVNPSLSRGYNLVYAGGLLRFVIGNAAGNLIRVSFGSLSTGTWQQVVVTYDGSSSAAGLKLYVNGVERTPTVLNNNLTATTVNTNNLQIGASNGGFNFYNGLADEFIATNTALTALQVTQVYNGGVPIDPRTLSFASDIQLYNQLGDSVTGATINSLVGVNLTNINGATTSTDVP
jgi:hypothetical protein